MDRRVLPIGFLLVLAAGGIVVHAPGVQAQAATVVEDFEDYSLGSLPCLPTSFVAPCTTEHDFQFTTPSGSMQVATPAAGLTGGGAKAFQITTGSAYMNSGGADLCGAPISFAVRGLNAGGNVRLLGQLSGSTSWRTYSFFYFSLTPGGAGYAALQATNTVNGAGATGNAGGTANMIFTNSFSSTAWYQFTIYCPTGAGAGSMTLYSPQAAAINNPPVSGAVSANGGANFQGPQYIEFGGGASAQYDNVETIAPNPLPTITGDEVIVSGLTGGSMDAGGQNIIARLDDGETIATYGASDLTQIATTSTPNCTGRHDGVNAALYAGESWMTYVDCDEDGESDSFKIRNYALDTPDFPCEEATGNVDNNDEVDIPNDLGDIGTISDLNPSYESRCDDDLVNKASVGWGFSTIGGAGVGGRIGTFAVTYNSGLLADYTDEDNRVLDSTSSPEIDGFCAWQNPDTGKDYIAGVGSIAQTGVYEVQSSVVRTAPADPTFKPEVELVQKFLNSGTYGGGVGLACAKDSIAVYTVNNQVHLLDDITTSPVAAPGWPKAATASAEDGVAMSGSSTYIAILDGVNIKVYHRNGTLTANFAAPAGSFHNMEFDNSGEHLAVFTSTRIKVFDTSEATCEIDGNCAELGNLEDEGGPLTSFTSTGTATAAPALLPGLEDPALIAVFPGGATGAKTFFGVILIALLTFGFAAIWLPLGILGAVLGLAMAIGFGLLGAWVAVLVVIICGAVIALIFGRK